MVGSIDPRCETVRGSIGRTKSWGCFGTRVAEPSWQRYKPTASTGRTYGCKRSDQTLKNSCARGPSTYGFRATREPVIGRGSRATVGASRNDEHGSHSFSIEPFAPAATKESRCGEEGIS